MTEDLILAIDNGTQSIRALAFNRQGELIDKAQVALEDYTHPQPGWMEHDVEAFYTALCHVCQQLWRQNRVKPEQIKAVVPTTQRATVINLDSSGTPLRPAIVWPDQRLAEVRSKRPLVWRILFRLLGLKPTIDALEQACEINWISQNEPEVWKSTSHFVLLSGYLNYKLTGEIADSIGNQVGYIPFDYKAQDWCKDGDWKWSCMPVRRDQLPRLVQTGEILGQITKGCSGDTGIPFQTPVIAGAADKACEVLGSGCVDPSVGSISCGTTATINVTHHKYLEPRPFIPPYPAAMPGVFNLEVQIFRGFWMVNWLKNVFGLNKAATSSPDETAIEQYIRSTEPGAEGLVLQPYWNPGLGEPGPEARGSIIGFTDTHTKAHIYRALIEGLAYGLREGKELLEKRGKQPFLYCRVAGGGSQSDGVMQILADVLNCPCERPSTYEASGLGAAIIGAAALGMHTSITEACQNMTGTGQRFVPHKHSAQLYDAIYQKVYKRQYQQLKPLFQSLFTLFTRT
jgi:sugar (pentulose or hexulose) kinase